MKIDSHLLKLSTSPIYIESPLELGSEVTVIVKGTVVKIQDKDNQDNSFNRQYVIKGELAEDASPALSLNHPVETIVEGQK